MQPPTPVREFPALILSAAGVGARGAFAEAQREFFDPDPEELESLRSRLKRAEAGLLAHYYMDPELQGLIFGCDWPHLRVSDSLAMADAAIEMAEAGARRVVVLGVDFMSENVRAMLDAAGHEEVEVYRCAEPAIGLSLIHI